MPVLSQLQTYVARAVAALCILIGGLLRRGSRGSGAAPERGKRGSSHGQRHPNPARRLPRNHRDLNMSSKRVSKTPISLRMASAPPPARIQ